MKYFWLKAIAIPHCSICLTSKFTDDRNINWSGDEVEEEDKYSQDRELNNTVGLHDNNTRKIVSINISGSCRNKIDSYSETPLSHSLDVELTVNGNAVMTVNACGGQIKSFIYEYTPHFMLNIAKMLVE